MLLSIKVPRIAQWLQQAAQAQGTTPTDVAEQLLATHIPESLAASSSPTESPDAPEQPLPFYATASDEEWAREFEAWVNSHPRRAPLPPEAFERATFYQDERHLTVNNR